jgi:hypothetical protein
MLCKAKRLIAKINANSERYEMTSTPKWLGRANLPLQEAKKISRRFKAKNCHG